MSDDEIGLFFYALCDRFAHGSRNMASSIGVKGQDLDKTDRRSLNPPANITEYEKGGSSNAISGDEDACRTTLDVIDSKPDADAAGGTVDKTGCELRSNDNDKECSAVEEPDHFWDDVPPMHILRYSSHRDGSIYRDIHDSWKREFGIADRNESK